MPVFLLINNRQFTNTDPPRKDKKPLTAGHRGYHIRSGGHNLTLQDWRYYMDFADGLWGGK